MVKKHKSINEILNMSYNATIGLLHPSNEEQLLKTVEFLRKQANQRIDRLRKDEVARESPILYTLDKEGNRVERSKFKASTYKKVHRNKGKVVSTEIDHTKLVEEFSSLKRFLNAKTSTKKGYYEVREQLANRIGSSKLFRTDFKSERSKKIWLNRERRFWNIYNKLVEEKNSVFSAISSTQLQKILENVMSKGNYVKSKDEQVMDAMRRFIDAATKDKNSDIITDIEESFIDYYDEGRMSEFTKRFGGAKKWEERFS